MKNIILWVLLIASFPAYSQNETTGLPVVDGKIKFVDIVNVTGSNKNTLFLKAQAWVGQNLKNNTNDIVISDPINSIISGEYITGTKGREPKYKLTYTITCKDDKYRLEIENIHGFLDLSSISGNPGSWVPIQRAYDVYLKKIEKGKDAPAFEKTYKKVREDMDHILIAPLKAYMTKTSTDF